MTLNQLICTCRSSLAGPTILPSAISFANYSSTTLGWDNADCIFLFALEHWWVSCWNPIRKPSLIPLRTNWAHVLSCRSLSSTSHTSAFMGVVMSVNLSGNWLHPARGTYWYNFSSWSMYLIFLREMGSVHPFWHPHLRALNPFSFLYICVCVCVCMCVIQLNSWNGCCLIDWIDYIIGELLYT